MIIVTVVVLVYKKDQTKQNSKQSTQELRNQREILEIRKFADMKVKANLPMVKMFQLEVILQVCRQI